MDLNMLHLYLDVRDDDRLGKWWPLPRLGGNSIMLRTATDPARDLLMFPRLRGYEFWFRSSWNGDHILLQDADILKVCPAGQVWPWCSWCRRFLLPVADHRVSRSHAKYYKNEASYEREHLRNMCLEHLRRHGI